MRNNIKEREYLDKNKIQKVMNNETVGNEISIRNRYSSYIDNSFIYLYITELSQVTNLVHILT